ncbi:hypothetical protein TWF696_008800 [Orbilia brochopaga]|uniref:Mitochondrial adapter protein MCP1 transmembrane domain-containing protein n=1 Tax=Orbilia brochopaga TaxID=3140254 RepID=A0AAV9UGW8_9PEZI
MAASGYIFDEQDMSDPLQLQLLDPSPVDSPLQSPVLSPSTVPRNHGQSHSSRGVVYYLTKTQRLSSYAFTGFLGIHFATTGILPLISLLETAENSLILSRVLYQNRFLEPTLVVGSLGVHVLSGVALRIIQRVRQYRRYDRIVWIKDLDLVHLTGYALIPTVMVHFGIVRGLPLVIDGGSEGIGISFIAHGFSVFRYISWTVYGSLATLGAYHAVQGLSRWWCLSKRWRRVTFGVIVGIAGTWLASVTRLSRIGRAVGHLGRHYDMLYSTLLDSSGRI